MSRASRPDGHSCLAAGKREEGGTVGKDTDRKKEKERLCVCVCVALYVCACLAALLIVLWHFLGHVPTQRGIPLIQHPTPTPLKKLYTTDSRATHKVKSHKRVLTQKETAPLMLITIAPHRACRQHLADNTKAHEHRYPGPGHRMAT